ncbi:NADH-quinone oxidoreductase subunit C [Roseomonas sp. OT10]|uniref:hydrogenase large subunit n=1 Tax=Roseomonas cutis TaxID=2897332 RepID=UPI001E5B6FEE|nr:NADH-quinone oxidoreductase subunit C [Roseomonas sp. OT10]UFN49456.1 NADH-quinone oxidoreductase subunit C [Roseomonas sp. OT10]
MTGPATRLLAAGRRSGVRHVLTVEDWALLPAALEAQPEMALLGLWAEPGMVHAAFWDEAEAALRLASSPAREGRYAALSPARPGAALFERAVRDLWGLEATGAVDSRPWLDHGRWLFDAPLSEHPVRRSAPPPQMTFLPAEGEGIHQIAVGPVHAGVIEPGHFRFHVQGEIVVRLEARLGYAHKGTLGLMLGKSPRAAARFAARLSGDSTVAHGWAFAMAAEAAAEAEVPPRALLLRALMAELERTANHLNDWGFICNDAAFAYPHARCGWLREGILRACEAAFGHRLMMDRVVPGGVAAELTAEGAAAILAAAEAAARDVPKLLAIYEEHASLQDRMVGTGVVRPERAALYAAGGPVGRASGRAFDARTARPHAPYHRLGLAARPVLGAGDVDARVRVRVAELRESLALVPQIVALLEPGEIAVPLPARAGEGVGMVEAFRGEALHWLALDEAGLIRAVFPRDASWLHWPLLEAAIEGNIVADFPLCNKSFNASYSGVDL